MLRIIRPQEEQPIGRGVEAESSAVAGFEGAAEVVSAPFALADKREAPPDQTNTKSDTVSVRPVFSCASCTAAPAPLPSAS